MPPQLLVAVVVGLAASAAWTTLPNGLAIAASIVAALAGAAWLAFQIVSPRSQWFVPTVFRVSPQHGALALTFDDGPDPVFTPQVLELLAQHGARATFFMVGSRALAHPQLVRQVLAAGHQIGSHTFDHAHSFHFAGAARMAAEITRGIDAIASVGSVRPNAFRPPVGLRVPTLRRALRRVGAALTCYTWTERGLDTFGRPADRIVARLAPHLRPGAILTLHDGAGLGGSGDRTATIVALRELLARMQQAGLTSRRLDELHGEPKPAPAAPVAAGAMP